MDDYITDRKALEQFVDELFKQKPLPANSAEELHSLREETIKKLDDSIGVAIFGSLNEQQLEELNQTLDSGEDTPEFFQKFFSDAGIDLKQTMSSTMENFRKEFLGGENA